MHSLASRLALVFAGLMWMCSAAAGENPTLPLLTQEELLLAATGSLAAYRLRDDPRVLVLDFPDSLEQGKAFARIILFVERADAPKTRLLTASELKHWLQNKREQTATLTAGNDFRAGELAHFFNTSRLQNEPLTPEELDLRRRLIDYGALQETACGVAATLPEAVVISIPQVSAVADCRQCTITQQLRRIIIGHELSHARFATDDGYRSYVLWFWSHHLTGRLRARFSRFLGQRGYDTAQRHLMANEMQAFLAHTPDEDIFSAKSLGISQKEFDQWQAAFNANLTIAPN